jgi:hypothetical protein
MFWGDSHVEQLYPLIKQLYNNGDLQNRGAILAIGSGCLPDEHLNNVEAGYHCDSFSKFTLLRAQKEDIDTVFIGFSTWTTLREHVTCVSVEGRCVTALSGEELRRRFLADLSDEIRTLHDSGKKVVVSLPFPVYDKRIPELEISNAVFGRFGLSETALDVTSPSLREEITAAAVRAGADIFDPRSALCQGQDCVTQMRGISIYKDTNHIAGSQIRILESNLRQALHLEPVK